MAVVPMRRPNVVLADDNPQQGGSPVLAGDAQAKPNGPLHVTIEDTENGDLQLTIGPARSQRPERRAGDFDENLAEHIDDQSLAALASTLLDGIDADIQSRREWEDTANAVADYLGIKLEDPVTSVAADGTVCQSISSAMLKASMKLWGVARAELLPVKGPVKVRRDAAPTPDAGSDLETTQGDMEIDSGDAPPPAAPPIGIGAAAPPTGIGPAPASSKPDGEKLALALESDMNHYLTVRDRGYYPDFSKMLMNRALIGLAFRKVYRDPLKRQPVSRWVKGQDLIVSNTATSLDDAGRYSERIRLRQATMRRMQVAGHYRDITLTRPTGQVSTTELAVADAEGIAASPQLPQDFEHTVYECYCELGSGTAHSLIGDLSVLDEDENGKVPGYPLPYRVSIDLDSRQVLEIRRNWKRGDTDHTARRRYVKYGFIPGLGFYDWGLIHIVGNPTQSATMIQRATVDTALFANFPGGVYLKSPGSRQTNTVIRPNVGEFIGMDAGGAESIRDMLMPMPYKDPSAVSLELMQKLEGDVAALAGIIELPVGEGRLGTTPVGTIMSYIESVTQVPGAVHKDDHIAQQDEFELLRELFAEDPESLVRGVKRPARRWQIAEEIMDPELVPAADPNTPSEVHRLLKVQAAVTLGGMPQFGGTANNRAIYKWAMESIIGDRAEAFTLPAQTPKPPPPDPRVVAAQIKAEADTGKAQMQQQTEGLKHQERMAEIAAEGEQREADRESAETRAALGVEGDKLKAAHQTVTAAADRMHSGLHQTADRQQADRHKAADITHQQFTTAFTADQAAQKPPPDGEEGG